MADLSFLTSGPLVKYAHQLTGRPMLDELFRGTRYEGVVPTRMGTPNLNSAEAEGLNSRVYRIDGPSGGDLVVKIPQTRVNLTANRADLSGVDALLQPLYMHPKGYMSVEQYHPVTDSLRERMKGLRDVIIPELNKTPFDTTLHTKPSIVDMLREQGLGSIPAYERDTGAKIDVLDMLRDANMRETPSGDLKLIDRGVLTGNRPGTVSPQDELDWARFLRDYDETSPETGQMLMRYQFADPTGQHQHPLGFRAGGLAHLACRS